jgi:hypothetical protein
MRVNIQLGRMRKELFVVLRHLSGGTQENRRKSVIILCVPAEIELDIF